MRAKLTLKLEDLSVDSFDTAVTQQEKGTVFGEQECTCPTACETACTCPGCPSCEATCLDTCDDDTCVYSCECVTVRYTNCWKCTDW